MNIVVLNTIKYDRKSIEFQNSVLELHRIKGLFL
jgi:hypothetical protein